tara:strand:- start:883 stop:2229 length:1347 start_codon:yes stop_codon:yes gene_type:complete
MNSLKGSKKEILIGFQSRKAVFEILMDVEKGAFADISIDRIFKKYDFSKLDRNLVTEITYGVIRNKINLDFWVNNFAKVSPDKQPLRLRYLLYIGIYQIIFMDRIPSSAVVNTTVELAKEVNLGKLSGVVNGVLRNIIRFIDSGKEIKLPVERIERISIKYSLPIWIVKNLINWVGFDHTIDFASVSNLPSPLDIRVNRLRISSDELIDLFESKGVTASPINDRPYGLEIQGRFGSIRGLPGYEEGLWSVQDRSSQWVSPLLEASEGEKILDACAAPGGKATHLAELINNNGTIWAVDKSHNRLKRLRENIERLGLDCIKTIHSDASQLIEIKPYSGEYFDKVLLDAPCSGLGTLSRHPDARWKINESVVDELVMLQSKLLISMISLLKPGGLLVYSTCTIHPSENQEVTAKFDSKFKEMELIYQKQIWPYSIKSGDGFYVAIFKKNI